MANDPTRMIDENTGVSLRHNDYRGDRAIDTLQQAKAAIEEVLEENAKLRRALVELDCGGGNYLTVRLRVAELSGIPAMATTFDGHMNKIKEKLEAKHA